MNYFQFHFKLSVPVIVDYFQDLIFGSENTSYCELSRSPLCSDPRWLCFWKQRCPLLGTTVPVIMESTTITVGTFEKDNHRFKFCFSISMSLLSPITDPNPDFWSIQYGQCIHMNQWPPKEIWANYGFTRKLELSVSSLHILLQLETNNNMFVTWWNPCFIPYTSLLFTFSKGIRGLD